MSSLHLHTLKVYTYVNHTSIEQGRWGKTVFSQDHKDSLSSPRCELELHQSPFFMNPLTPTSAPPHLCYVISQSFCSNSCNRGLRASLLPLPQKHFISVHLLYAVPIPNSSVSVPPHDLCILQKQMSKLQISGGLNSQFKPQINDGQSHYALSSPS